ncbi:hypothetical protein [Legionella sp. km535]|uniref:hypothetical protein n=1 Tax=Legionella sp. km535 TaxID=2498107 RepID=UPI001F2B144E|nr:hypothetical protein [Legionella sp. km535]
MVYWVQGNAQQIFKAFDLEWLQRIRDNTFSSETKFLGTEQQASEFISKWESTGQVPHLAPGTISAANLFLIFGPPYQPFKLADENLAHYEKQFVRHDFAYFNDLQEPCGLTLIYRKDNPSQWFLGLMNNTHLAPEERVVTLLSGVDLKPYLKPEETVLRVSQADDELESLLDPINYPFIQYQLKNVIKAETGEIDLGAPCVDALSTYIQFDKSNDTHLKPNGVRERILAYNLFISPNMMRDLLHKKDGLQKELESVQLTDDYRLNKNLLQMIVVFYEEKSLKRNQDLLRDHEFIKDMGALMWDPQQIKLLPELRAKEYDLELVQLILSKEAYYRAFKVLLELGIAQDAPDLYNDPNKLEQLSYINSLTESDCRKLCLIFWAKGKLSLQELMEIVQATQQYPMLATTLVALDQSKRIISIKDLRKHVLNPLIHMQKSILHHFIDEFEQYGLNKSVLTKLSLEELHDLSSSFSVLKQAGITSSEEYSWVLKKNNQGQILRIFLPELSQIADIEQRKTLVNILYKGVQKGVVSQGKALLEITDKNLYSIALQLHKRFICVKQMQDLRFTNEVIALASEAESLNGLRFRNVIFQVEEQCKGVHERLRKSSTDRDKVSRWQRADEDYRRALYSIAFEGITQPGTDITSKIKQAEKKVLDIVDPEMKSWLHKILVIIANIVITTLTLGVANDIKERNTGNYWFFNQTTSGEKLRTLDKEVQSLIECPDSEIPKLK